MMFALDGHENVSLKRYKAMDVDRPHSERVEPSDPGVTTVVEDCYCVPNWIQRVDGGVLICWVRNESGVVGGWVAICVSNTRCSYWIHDSELPTGWVKCELRKFQN